MSRFFLSSPAARPTTAPSTRSTRSALLAGLLLLVAHSSSARAERGLSLADFEKRIAVLPELQRGVGEELEARADIAEASALEPIDLSYEREEVFVDGEGVPLKNSLSIGLSLDLSGRRGARVESASLAARAIRAENRFRAERLKLEATKLYYRAARARLRFESLSQSLAPLQALVLSTEERVAAGDASRFDLARFKLHLSEHEDQLAEAKTEQDVAEAALSALVGESESLSATDSMPLPSTAQAAPEQAGAMSGSRSDVRATDFAERSGQALLRAGKRWWVPTLGISLGYLNTDLGGELGIAHGYTGSLSASLPIFSRGKAEKERGAARIRKARIQRELIERGVERDYRQSAARLKGQLLQAQRFRESQLPLAHELALATESAYKGGEASSLELLDAQRRASESRLRDIELRYQCRLAELERRLALGVETE